MSRRHEALIPLTHDHHHALKRARLLAEAAQHGEVSELCATVQSFVSFCDGELIGHFREEEEQLLPLLAPGNEKTDGLVARILLEHVALHRLVRQLRAQLAAGTPDAETASETAGLLRAHIRMEEERLFPLIEQRVAEEDLLHLHLAPRHRAAPRRVPVR
jgi:hemerythrin-like domain-containing protein